MRIPVIPPEQPILADDAPGDMAGSRGDDENRHTPPKNKTHGPPKIKAVNKFIIGISQGAIFKLHFM